jgi:hypothetical protein
MRLSCMNRLNVGYNEGLVCFEFEIVHFIKGWDIVSGAAKRR